MSDLTLDAVRGIESYRVWLEERNRHVKVAREAVLNRARDVDRLMSVEAHKRLGDALREWDRQVEKVRARGYDYPGPVPPRLVSPTRLAALEEVAEAAGVVVGRWLASSVTPDELHPHSRRLVGAVFDLEHPLEDLLDDEPEPVE